MRRTIALSLMLATLAACERGESPTTAREAAPAADESESGTAPKPGETGPVELKDVSEITADYVIGITYSPEAGKYPGLAAELNRYANDARADLMQAVEARGPEETGTMYELSLGFSQVADTPRLFAIAADGSRYTGGAHSAPLLARFVWLVDEGQRLSIADLIPEGEDWKAISTLTREQLHTALSQRLDADELSPAERDSAMQSASRMIEEGTGPEPENYSEFEPVVGPDGKMTAIRFVFPPYQVGPYSDGEQSVQLSAAALLPHVAPEYRELFSTE